MFFHPKNLKSENNNPWFKPWFNILLHTQSINCVCHSVLGIYNFAALIEMCSCCCWVMKQRWICVSTKREYKDWVLRKIQNYYQTCNESWNGILEVSSKLAWTSKPEEYYQKIQMTPEFFQNVSRILIEK